jgi:hypothetical protein
MTGKLMFAGLLFVEELIMFASGQLTLLQLLLKLLSLELLRSRPQFSELCQSIVAYSQPGLLLVMFAFTIGDAFKYLKQRLFCLFTSAALFLQEIPTVRWLIAACIIGSLVYLLLNELQLPDASLAGLYFNRKLVITALGFITLYYFVKPELKEV